jgi:phage tail sheath protein FI
MLTLNTDQKEISFIIGDTPARLKPNQVATWATNANNAAGNGEIGLTASNVYIGLYYPWGLSTNIDGTEVMVPPSTVALRTMAYNDQVAYPWFAPAGFQRGLITNASSVGYLSDEGEFTPVILNQGQRDVLYTNKINPLAYIPGRGLVVYGQKTLSPLESALDRVNVARLANYLKFNLNNLVKPFLFEQNDAITRDAAKTTVERFLMGLVGLRALEDFAVLCDTQNNTPERRDRNELWIDILIKPLKAIEFIYIPVRIRNSGDSLTF